MKRVLLLILCLVLSFSICIGAAATQDRLLIRDEAGLLAEDEIAMLQERATEISDQYEMEIVIATVLTTGSRDVEAFAEDYYLDYGYGFGEDRTGVILLIAMDSPEGRICTVRTFGEARDAVSDDAADALLEGITNLLSGGMYYSAFNAFLNDLEHQIKDYVELTADEIAIYVVVALGVGALVGFITISVMKSGMKTAVFQRGASDYVRSGTYRILSHRDIFLYSHVTRVRRSNDSSGSGRSGGGRSGGSSRRF